MTSISASKLILITNTTYKADSGVVTNLPVASSWPLNIINTTPTTTTLVVSFSSGITYSNIRNYFICGSNSITFDGNNNMITVGVNLYPGLIDNYISNPGTSYSNITVQNIKITATTNTFTTSSTDGWICKANFGVAGTNIIIQNCGVIGVTTSLQSGGICGSRFVRDGGIGLIKNCYNVNGFISANSYGIVGINCADKGTCIIKNCYNSSTFPTNSSAAGIAGNFLGRSGKVYIINCYNNGFSNGYSSHYAFLRT